MGGGGGEEVALGMQCPATKSGYCRGAGFKYEREIAIFLSVGAGKKLSIKLGI